MAVRKCASCGKKFQCKGVKGNPFFPFCSKNCKLADLGRWFRGDYAVVEDLARGLDLSATGLDPTDPDIVDALDAIES